MHRNWSRHEKRLTSRCPSYLATSRRNVCSGRCCTSWVKTTRPCDMTASRSVLGPASGGDALESVTGKDRSSNDVKQPLTRLVINFYRRGWETWTSYTMVRMMTVSVVWLCLIARKKKHENVPK